MTGHRIGWRIGAGVVLALLAAGCAKAEAIKIASTRSSSNAPLLIAKEKGYFAAEGLDAEIVFIDSAGPITSAVVSGDVEFGATGLSGAFYNLAAQGALRIVAGHIYEAPGFRGTTIVASNRAWDGGFTATKTADERGAMIQRFLRGFRHATQDYHAAFTDADGKPMLGPGSDEIIAILVKYDQQSPEQIKSALAYVDTDGRVDVHDVLRQIAWYKSQGMIKGEIDGESVIDRRYVIPLPPH
jgi:hypothetical protein